MKKLISIIAFVSISACVFSQTDVWVKQELVFGESQNNNIWNQGSIIMPEIIEFNGGYRMYYSMVAPDSSQIQFADSPDGITWTYSGVAIKSDTSKSPSNRIWLVGAPSIIKYAQDSFRLYYSSTEYYTSVPKYCIKSAFSTDGTNFVDEGIRIEIYPHDSLSPVQLAGHGTFFLNDSGSVTGIFSADPTNSFDPSNLFIATSTDGLHFTNFIDKYEDWHDPIVVKKNGQYFLYATYLNYKKGKAISTDGVNWPAQLDSISFQDSLGNPLTVVNDGIGDVGGILMPSGEIWLYTNYGIPSRNFALFRRDNTQSIKKEIGYKYEIFPNPINQNSKLIFEHGKDIVFTLFDAQGKIISQKNLHNTNQLLLKDYCKLKKGMYFYVLSVDNEIVTDKLVIQ